MNDLVSAVDSAYADYGIHDAEYVPATLIQYLRGLGVTEYALATIGPALSHPACPGHVHLRVLGQDVYVSHSRVNPGLYTVFVIAPPRDLTPA